MLLVTRRGYQGLLRGRIVGRSGCFAGSRVVHEVDPAIGLFPAGVILELEGQGVKNVKIIRMVIPPLDRDRRCWRRHWRVL